MKWIRTGRQLGQAVKNVQRLRQIILVFSKHGFVDIVDRMNRRVSSTESIKRFAILDRDFEIARDEITPTGKLKRDVIVNRFRDLIDRLYLAADERG